MAISNVGLGKFRYEVNKEWAKIPKEQEFGDVSDVATDSQDRVYVYHRGEHPVSVFDRDGNFLTSWGKGVILDAHGIFVSPDDHIYVADRDAHQVLKFTPEGKLVLALGKRHQASLEEPFNHPADVAVSPTGEIYVADGYANSRVHKFSADGKHLLSWGSPGSGPGQFIVPHSIWVGPDGRVYICDRENGRVQVFTSDGEFISQWIDFYRPTNIFGDASGAFYVTDLIPRFSVLDREGNLLARGRMEGTVHGIWGDSRGDLYVSEVFEQAAYKLVKQD